MILFLSAIDDILEQSARALQGVPANSDRSGHGVLLELSLNGATDPVVVAGCVQVLNRDPETGRHINYQNLHVAENLPTHAVHILRSDLDDAEVDPALVREITPPSDPNSASQDPAATYRVRHFTNDLLTSPEVSFYCTLG